MRNIVKLFAGLAVCSFSLAAHAASPDDTQMCVVSKDGNTKTFNLRDLKKIVFHESELSIVDCNDKENKAEYSKLRKLWFLLKPTDVSSVTTKRLFVSYRDEAIYVDGWTEGNADVAIYDVGGSLCTTLKAWNGGKINVSHLPKGMYILKIKSYSMKFIVK